MVTAASDAQKAKAPEKQSEQTALQTSSSTASSRMLEGVYGFDSRKPSDKTAQPDTVDDHLPKVSFESNHNQKPLDTTVPKDAQERITQKVYDGSTDTYEDKNGNRVQLHKNDHDYTENFKVEIHPDGSRLITNGDGSTREINDKQVVIKDKHSTATDDRNGHTHTDFDDGRSEDRVESKHGYTLKSTGPKAQDNFYEGKIGDQTTRVTAFNNGETHFQVKFSANPENGYDQITYGDGSCDRKYNNGTIEKGDRDGNLVAVDKEHNRTITRVSGDVFKENHDGSKVTTSHDSDGNIHEFGTGPKPGDNYNSVTYKNGDTTRTTDYGDGHTKDQYTSKDSTKNLTIEKFKDGSISTTDRDGTMHIDKDGVGSYTTVDGKTLEPMEIFAYKAQQRIELNNISNDGGGDTDYENKVREGLDKLPQDVQKLMSANGVKIRITSDLTRLWPEEKGVQAAGYPKGTTMDEVAASYEPRRKEVGMAQRSNSGDVPGTVRHEAGHAVDALANKLGTAISDSDGFRDAYAMDVAKMTDEQKMVKAYFLQDENGRAEAFAELSADRFGGREPAEVQLDTVMPNSAKFVNSFYDNHMLLQAN